MKEEMNKINPAEALLSAVEACERTEATLLRERKLVVESTAEMESLSATSNLFDRRVVERLTALSTILRVGPTRLAARERELEAEQRRLLEMSRGFVCKVLGPRLRNLEARALARVEQKLELHFPDKEALRSAATESTELSALKPIQDAGVFRFLSPDDAIRQAKVFLEAWHNADAFEQKHLG